jgi:hypothetical protein
MNASRSEAGARGPISANYADPIAGCATTAPAKPGTLIAAGLKVLARVSLTSVPRL